MLDSFGDGVLGRKGVKCGLHNLTSDHFCCSLKPDIGWWVFDSSKRQIFDDDSLSGYEGLEGSIKDILAANSKIGVKSEYIEEAIDRQSQNHSTQDQNKYQLIGTEFFHYTGLRAIRLRV